jgi:hypothetical protein
MRIDDNRRRSPSARPTCRRPDSRRRLGSYSHQRRRAPTSPR